MFYPCAKLLVKLWLLPGVRVVVVCSITSTSGLVPEDQLAK